jgi:hypothetical protein
LFLRFIALKVRLILVRLGSLQVFLFSYQKSSSITLQKKRHAVRRGGLSYAAGLQNRAE